MNREEFEEMVGHKIIEPTNESDDWCNIATVDILGLWQWIEQKIKESHKCAGCGTLLYYQYHCQYCKRLLET